MESKLQVSDTILPGVKIVTPRVFLDGRGGFVEAFNQRDFEKCIGNHTFVQDNQSVSNKYVIRGIHYQICLPQGKLVRVSHGMICDVAVDLRKSSKNFKKYVAIFLSKEYSNQLWIPPGFGHAFISLEDNTVVEYKVTNYYNKYYDKCINIYDPDINIDWNFLATNNKTDLPITPFLRSEKDKNAPMLKNTEVFE